MDFILVHYENRNETSVYFTRRHDIITATLQYMIVRLNCQDESGLFFGTFVGYASGRSLNSSGFVESSALQFVYPYTSGIYRVEDNNELILVGYISHENLRSLYRHRCPECERLFRYPSILNDHLNVHTGDRRM